MNYIKQTILAMLLSLWQFNVSADWSGFPVADSGNRNDWEKCRTNLLQIISALDERSKATEAFTGFQYINSYAFPAGYTNGTTVISVGFPDVNANYAYIEANPLIDGTRIAYNVAGYYIAIEIFGTFIHNNSGVALYESGSGGTFFSDNWGSVGGYGDIHGARTYQTNNMVNKVLCYTNIVCTNLNPTTYKYKDPTSGAELTAIATPPVTQEFMAYLDNMIDFVIPYFVCQTNASDGDFNDWFAKGNATNHPNILQMWNKAALFDYLKIGYVTNITYITNNWSATPTIWISGGDANFTRTPVLKNPRRLLYEATYTGGVGWLQKSYDTMDLKYYSNSTPIALYNPPTNKHLTPVSFTLGGWGLVTSNQTLTNITETSMIGSYTQQLTKQWYQITNFNCSSIAETGTTISILYNVPMQTYGTHPYSLYAEDLDERQKLLHELLWTAKSRDYTMNNSTVKHKVDSHGVPVGNDTWTGAMSDMQSAAPLQSIGMAAGRFIYGSLGRRYDPGSNVWLDTYYCETFWTKGGFPLVNLYTNLNPKSYCYYYCTTNAEYDWVFNMQGDTGLLKQYVKGDQEYSRTGEAPITNTVYIGGVDYPSTFNYPVKPTKWYEPKVKGYRILNPIWVVRKWDDGIGNNEFVYK